MCGIYVIFDLWVVITGGLRLGSLPALCVMLPRVLGMVLVDEVEAYSNVGFD